MAANLNSRPRYLQRKPKPNPAGPLSTRVLAIQDRIQIMLSALESAEPPPKPTRKAWSPSRSVPVPPTLTDPDLSADRALALASQPKAHHYLAQMNNRYLDFPNCTLWNTEDGMNTCPYPAFVKDAILTGRVLFGASKVFGSHVKMVWGVEELIRVWVEARRVVEYFQKQVLEKAMEEDGIWHSVIKHKIKKSKKVLGEIKGPESNHRVKDLEIRSLNSEAEVLDDSEDLDDGIDKAPVDHRETVQSEESTYGLNKETLVLIKKAREV